MRKPSLTFHKHLFAAAFLFGLLLQSGWADDANLQSRMLVVYNSNVEDSRILAEHYASVRNIPSERVLGLDCSKSETITRSAYEKTIHEPINTYIKGKGWIERVPDTVDLSGNTIHLMRAIRNDVWCMVLMYGMPLRIEEEPGIPPEIELAESLRTNRASVDSELSLLPVDGLPLAGFIPNPYFSDKLTRPYEKEDSRNLILVCRLDAPSPSDVRRMIDDASRVEKLELTGRACFDSRGIQDQKSSYLMGDQWIENAAYLARMSGLETTLDKLPTTIPASEPLDDIALYFGWYTTDMDGPFSRKDFRFRPGAIAYHLHSFSAQTVHSETSNWAGPLLAKGATATMGSVYEPYLRFTPDISVFTRSLLTGYTFAEAAYQSQLGLSWTMTMLGDPLYRPFPRHFLDTAKLAEQSHSPELEWLMLRVARHIASSHGESAPKLEKLATLVALAPESPVFNEGYAEILSELGADETKVNAAFHTAEDKARSTAGHIRIGLKWADYYAAHNHVEEAMAVYEKLVTDYPTESSFYGVPGIAFKYAARSGWQKISPNIQEQMAPVQEPAPGTPSSSAPQPIPPAFKPSVGGSTFSD